MGSLVRLRVSLVDRPGSLAQVAAVIARQGGNITSVDVQRVQGDRAVDDLVVEFSGEPDLAALREDLASNGAAILVSQQETQAADPIVGSLRRVAELVDAGATDSTAVLAEGVGELCSSPVVWVSGAVDAARYDAGRFALERHVPVALRTTQLPDHLAERLPGEVYLLAVPDTESDAGGRVIFVARPLTNDFTSTEIARIEALTYLHGRIERLVARQRE